MHEDRPTEIAGFRIESEIGRGGMGVVYLATQSFPERRVALKVLSSELAGDLGFRERFIRESNAAASLEHPNVVPVYAAGEEGGRLYLAMRFVEGTDLRSLITGEGPLPPERAARICAQVADALEAAHERGMVHRDVKPGNVLLDARDHAYLSDFGLIKPTRIDTELTRTGQFMGSLEYVAPEQIRGDAVDARADVYSLGCVLYECLTGRPPFHRENEVATLYAHMEEPAPKPSTARAEVPRELDAVVERAMAKRPADRFQMVSEMAGALRGSAPSARGGKRPRRALLAVVGVAAVLALGAAGLAIATRGDGTTSSPTGTTSAAAIPPDSLVQLDADTGEVLTTTGDMPPSSGVYPAIEAGEGAVWVFASGSLLRIDPSDPSRTSDVTVGSGWGVNSIALAERIVWTSTEGSVARVSATDLRYLGGVELGSAFDNARDIYLTAGAGAVWAVTGSGMLARVDPQTATKTGEVDVGQSATDIAAGLGAVWVADDLTATVTKVDPRTLEADAPIDIPGHIDDIEAGAGAVWVLDSEAGVVTPIDPDTGGLGAPVRVGVTPTDLASGLDALWVANNGDGTISKVDPITGSATVAVDLGAPAASIAVDEASRRLWVVISALPFGQN